MNPRLSSALVPALALAVGGSMAAAGTVASGDTTGGAHAALVHSAATAKPFPRPVILMVHGRGHADRDSAAVRRSAQAALSQGIRALGVNPGDVLKDGDVRLVWYADVARTPAHARARACGGDESRHASGGTEVVSFAGLVGVLLDVVPDPREPELRNLRDDVRYLSDRQVQCAAEQRLHVAAMRARQEGRPVLVVAHSMGALVSWGYFQRRDDAPHGAVPAIASFVTLGSPLGSEDVRTIVFGSARSLARLPSGVHRWVNVVDANDPFAVPIVGPRKPGAAPSRRVDLWTTTVRNDPHLLEGYLRDPAGARAVIDGWCAAVPRIPGSMERACAAVSP